MWSRETWNKIMIWLRKVRINRRPKQAWRTVHHAKPELEWLTPRIVPANNACTFIGPVGGGPGAWNVAANWAPINGVPTMPDDTGSDTATIAAGATCVLDQTDEVKIAGLDVEGSLTTKSMITVAAGGSIGDGTTFVDAGALLDVTTPDISGNNSTLETDMLTTAASGPPPNLSIDDNASVEVNLSATLSGDTTVTGLLEAKNIDAFSGATVTLDGPGSVGGAGQLEAGDNANIIFDPASAWTILPGDPVGGALKEGKFIVDGPLTVATDFVNNAAEITLEDDGSTTAGSIIGTGSVDWWNTEFDWTGGLIAPAGGFTIDDNSDFKTDGPNAKTLGTNMTIVWTAEFGGAGSLTITSGNTLLNTASAIMPIDVSLPLITGAGLFDNAGSMSVNPDPTNGLTIASVFTNEADGVIDCETGAGPLALTDSSGSSVLNGKLSLNNDSLTIGGVYTTDGFDEDWSPSDLTTLTGTLIVASNSADFDQW